MFQIQAPSHHPDYQARSKSWKLPTKERVIQENVRLEDVQAETTFMLKEIYGELLAESLWIDEEMANA